jgi:glycosyltransferase involved in cell wall biosynthesis
MSELRALVVEPAGSLWGSERVLLDFLSSVAGSPWRIGVCCPPGTPIIERLARLPVEIYPAFVAGLHRKNRFDRLRATVGLLLAALRFRPRLLYVNQAGATRIAVLVGRMLQLPVIAHVRLAEDVSYLQSLGAGTDELPLVLCISHYIRSLFNDWNLEHHSRLVVMYDPYLPQKSWNGTHQCETTNPEPVFSCVGRLTRTKGQDILLDAMHRLKGEGIEAQGLFFGAAEPGDSFGTDLVELSVDLGIAGQVHWQGFHEYIPSLMPSSVALVCPSHEEALGRVIFEAWDGGTIPVAWAGSGGPAEVIQASAAGLLYDKQTGASLARALKHALALTPLVRQQMVKRGRQWLERNCEPDAYGQKMLALWQDAAKQS